MNVTKREFLTILAGGVAGVTVGQAAQDDGEELVGGIVGGGGDEDEPAFEIDPTTVAGLYVVESESDLTTPPASPAVVVTLDAGLLTWTADETATDATMPEAQEHKIATSIDDLEQPDRYPAVAVTAEEGLLIDLGDGGGS